jgi:hypothetical protein
VVGLGAGFDFGRNDADPRSVQFIATKLEEE